MKTSETIKSHASLASTPCGRAYRVARLRAVMAILAAGVLWGYSPTEGAKGDFLCSDDAVSEGTCDPAPLLSPHVTARPQLVDLLRFETPDSLFEGPGAGNGNGFKSQFEGHPDSDGGPLGNPESGTQIFNTSHPCSECHDADGSGFIGPDIQGYSRVQIRKMLLPPTTHSGGEFLDLTDQDFADIEAFLSTNDSKDTAESLS